MKRKLGFVPLIGLLVATLALSGCSGLRVGATPELAPSITPTTVAPTFIADATPSTSLAPRAPTLDEKATIWVSMLLSNFADPGLDTETCATYKPGVDLTEVHFYFDEREKESAGAFGPDFGSTPCEVSINLVERLYRDPMLLADKAVEWKDILNNGDLKAEDFGLDLADNSPEAVAQLANGPFEDREQLAEAVLALYSAPEFVLSIQDRNEAYQSRGASGDGGTPSTAPSSDDKSSTILVVKGETTGGTVKEDRLDCGLQDYKPRTPPPPPTTPPVEEKNPSLDPAPRGNAPEGGGRNQDSGSGTYIPPTEMKQPPATSYVAPAAPEPVVSPAPVGSTPDPAPAPAPETSAAPATKAEDGGCSPAPGETTC